MRFFLVLLLSLASLQAVHGREVSAYQIESQYNCVGGDCAIWTGTCILVKAEKGYAWFLTVGHNLPDKKNMGPGGPKVIVGNHKYGLSKIQEWPVDFMDDSIALMRSTEPIPERLLKVYPLESREPKVGDVVWLVGYPFNKYTTLKTTIVRVDPSLGLFETKDFLNIGASGGMVIYHESGTLGGIIHAVAMDGSFRGIHSKSSVIYKQLEEDFEFLLVDNKRDKEKPEENIVKVKPVEPTPTPTPTPVPDPISTITKEELESKISDVSKAQDERFAEMEVRQGKHMEDLKTDILDSQEKALTDFREETSKAREKELGALIQSIGAAFNNVQESINLQNNKIQQISEDNKASYENIVQTIKERDGGLRDPFEIEPVTVDPSEDTQVAQPEETQVTQPSTVGTIAKGAASYIPWQAILLGLGVTVPTGLAGFLAFKGAKYLWNVRKGANEIPTKDDSSVFQRDVSEAKQILGLRQSEEREPVSDAVRGIFFQDEFNTNPDQSLKDAYEAVNARFNSVVPLSTSHKTVGE